MLAKRIVGALPDALKEMSFEMSRRTKEVLGVFSTIVVFALEFFIASSIGFSHPIAIIALAVAAITIIISAWQTDLTRRPDTVIGASLGTMSVNSLFLLVISAYALIVTQDPSIVLSSVFCIVVSIIGLLIAACCWDLFKSTMKVAKQTSDHKPKAIIIPGKILIDGMPQWQLTRRCWQALELLEKDPKLLAVCCGGVAKNAVGDSKAKKEAEVMKAIIENSVKQRGHDDAETAKIMKRILEETSSSTTQGNFDNLAKIFRNIGFDYENTRFGIVTADYHMKRCVRCARKAGFKKLVLFPVKTQWDSAFADWNQEFYIQLRKIAQDPSGEEGIEKDRPPKPKKQKKTKTEDEKPNNSSSENEKEKSDD